MIQAARHPTWSLTLHDLPRINERVRARDQFMKVYCYTLLHLNAFCIKMLTASMAIEIENTTSRIFLTRITLRGTWSPSRVTPVNG